jgi:hypothetical protein
VKNYPSRFSGKKVGQCKNCGYENFTSRFNHGTCRAVVSCRKRTHDSRPAYLNEFFALPSAERRIIAKTYDAGKAEWFAAIDRNESPVEAYLREPLKMFASLEEVMNAHLLKGNK